MKRLTDRSKEIPLPLKENAAFWARAHEKLARYEDSGLDPEEIHELLHDTTGPLHKKLGQWIDAEKQGRLVVLPEPTPDIDFMRIFNLIMADAEDRVIILPCKVEDMVYYLRGRDILGDTVERIILDGIDNQVLVGAHKAFMFCDFGRNVFLTREEAEAALKGGTNGRNL